MMTGDLLVGLALTVSIANPIGAGTTPANTLAELGRQFDGCVRVRTSEGVGSEVTIVFSLKRDGSLLGKPRITHSHLVGDAAVQRRFIEAAIRAVAGCLPAKITSELGSAIAGRPFSIRIMNRARERDVSGAIGVRTTRMN